MRCTAFFGVHRDFIGIHPKTLSKAIFADLVTNNLFVIVATLIITSFIWVVKYWCVILTAEYRCCPGRWSTVILGKTYPPAPGTNFPNTYQHSNNYQVVKILTSFCSPPNTPTTRTHTTHGQEKIPNSIRNVIIIVFIIRWFIYLFCWLFFAFSCQGEH